MWSLEIEVAGVDRPEAGWEREGRSATEKPEGLPVEGLGESRAAPLAARQEGAAAATMVVEPVAGRAEVNPPTP